MAKEVGCDPRQVVHDCKVLLGRIRDSGAGPYPEITCPVCGFLISPSRASFPPYWVDFADGSSEEVCSSCFQWVINLPFPRSAYAERPDGADQPERL